MTSEELRKMGFSREVISEWETMENRIYDLEEELRDLKMDYEELKFKHRELEEEFEDRLLEAQDLTNWEHSTRRW